jgi:hypothetical protein
MKNKLAILAIIIVAGGLYAMTIRGIPGNPAPADFKNQLDQQTKPFELSPERGRYVHLVALANYGQYNLTKELAEAAFPDVGVYDGRYYSYFAPGLPYLVLPFYLLGAKYNLAQVGSFAFISFVSLLALIFLYRIAREILKLPVWASLASVLVFAFGSTAWSYAITLYQHHVTTYFMVSSFYAVWRFRKGGRWSFLWAGLVLLNYALAITIDYPNVLLLLPILVYLGISTCDFKLIAKKLVVGFRSSILIALLAFVAVTGLHFYHNTVHYGAWNHLSGGLQSYRYVDPTLDPIKAAQGVTPQDLNAQKNIVGFFKETRLPFGSYTLLVSNDRGLFLYAPIFLLAIFGIVWSYRRRMSLEIAILLGLIATNLFLYSSWGDPWGGWAYGPRYLIPSMAFLSLFVGVAVARLRYRILVRIIAFGLFVYSSGVALLGALTTNAVPPKVEADFLHTKYNFLFAWDVFRASRSGSYLYNTYASSIFSLSQYFVAIMVVLAVLMLVLLFIIPRFEKHD